MHTYVDAILVATIAILWPIWENIVAWPRFLGSLSVGDPGRVRIGSYRHTMLNEWVLCALTVVVWAWQGHAWTALPFHASEPWRIGLGVVIAAGVTAAMAQQVATVRAGAAARAAVRKQIGGLTPFLPRTPEELAWFRALSVTAGVCEEWLYRGVLTTLVSGWVGVPMAVALSAIAFGFGHAYQGVGGIARTALVGLVMSGIVLVTGSLVPAMIAHAAIDLGSGMATNLALTVVDEPAAGQDTSPK